jgi:hypothetical protein
MTMAAAMPSAAHWISMPVPTHGLVETLLARR